MSKTSELPKVDRIKLFLDGADRASMIEWNKDPMCQGFTTNPSLMRKSGVSDYTGFCKGILQEIKEKPVSFEVFSDDLEGMLRQALIIAPWGKNVYVKIPAMNSKGQSTTPIIRELTQKGVNLNVTAVFTLEQSAEICAALKGGAPSYLSVFAGRIADSGRDPIPVMKTCLEHCKAAGPQVELLWASTREVYNLIQAQEIGCHIITTPGDLIKKAKSLGKGLWDLSLETVQTFKKDAESAGFSL